MSIEIRARVLLEEDTMEPCRLKLFSRIGYKRNSTITYVCCPVVQRKFRTAKFPKVLQETLQKRRVSAKTESWCSVYVDKSVCLVGAQVQGDNAENRFGKSDLFV